MRFSRPDPFAGSGLHFGQMRGKRFALNLFLCRKGRVIKKVLGQTATGSSAEKRREAISRGAD
jgi:hypothetical protein